MEQDAVELKGEMAMQSILHIHTTDIEEIIPALEKKRDAAPQLFLNTPLVVDCKAILLQTIELDYMALRSGLSELGFVPVGIRHVNTKSIEILQKAGWALLRDSTARQMELKAQVKEENDADNDYIENRTKVIKRPVRSGQQVYSPSGDIVVLAHTSAGSEVLADGSVHIYGKLGGRVLAGINGDRSACIFCQFLEPELISIAGQYQLFDDAETSLRGQPAMISLNGDSLEIEPII